jgi:hypothetical protein
MTGPASEGEATANFFFGLLPNWSVQQNLRDSVLRQLPQRLSLTKSVSCIGVIQFEINATGFQGADRVQTERYAQLLSHTCESPV